MQVIITFYRNFYLVTIPVTAINCGVLITSGSPYLIFWLAIGKIATNLLLGIYFHLFRSDQLNFFHNLGFSTISIYSTTFLLDLVIWLIGIIISMLVI